MLQLAVCIIKNDPRILSDPPASAIVTSFDDSSIGIQLRCYISNVMQRSVVKSDLMIRLQKTFNDNGIDMVIINGDKPELLYDVSENKKAGTRFYAR